MLFVRGTPGPLPQGARARDFTPPRGSVCPTVGRTRGFRFEVALQDSMRQQGLQRVFCELGDAWVRSRWGQ